ncbi:putative GPI-anchored protein pfl2 isoform X2 [Gambusia affinis]|uniref:putative GPI-anchored protein pfl2 isoform X2 n=1 Tax=Gambusia affinis TaxID=33528 RepID=UPI001CDB6803|nr:putative GPI-anchored protein pfl2 isoform X2 [Gambusia affinis]
MALQLLIFILLLNLTHEAKAEALPQPNLTVDRLVMTETDSVTLNCSAPTHVSVSRCDFYIENKEMSSDSSCVKTLTGSEMLKKLNIRSPSDVKVKCSYVTKIDALDSSSSDSESTTIIINNLLPASLTVNPLVITESDSVTLTCRPPSSVSVSDCFFYIGEEKTPHIFSCVKMMTAADLLSLTKQSLPADIDVTCFYLNSHQSPKSNLLTIIIQLPPPELTVNPQQITETDSVTVNCGTPSSVPVESCSLYFINSKMSRSISCEQTLTGSDLLMMAHQTSPAEVELKCFYIVKRGGMHQSPDSNTSTVDIQKVQETDSTTFQKVTTVSVTAGQTFRTIKETESPFSPPPSSVNPTLFAATDPSGSTTVNTASTLSTSPSEATVVERQDWFPANTDPSGSTTVKTLDSPSEATADQKLSDKTKWMYVAAPGFGVGVGVVLLVGLLCSRRRSDIKTHRRPPVSYNDKFIGMRKVTNGGLLPVGDEDGYHTITSVPADDSAHEHVAINTQNSQNHDVYHVYSTIPEEPEEAAVAKQLYCTLQPH